MELSQGQVIQKPNKQWLSSLFMTHFLSIMHAPFSFINIFHTVKELWTGHFYYMELSQGQIIKKTDKQE